MACSTVTGGRMNGPVEHERRRPGAAGAPVRLADGRPWLLASPTFRPRPEGLTRPQVDQPLDRVFDCAALGEGLDLADIWAAARELLRANYDLTDDELAGLLSVANGSNLAMYPSVVFKVFIDGKEAAASPVMRIAYQPWRFDVAIPPGSKIISLAAMDAGNGTKEDRANWVDCGFVMQGAARR